MEYKLKFFKKSVFVAFILIAQAMMIYAYYIEKEFFGNIKWDYLSQVYYPAYKYQIEKNGYFQDVEKPPVKDTNIINAKGIPVLLYHGVVEREDGSNILVDNFRNQMFALKKAGYQTVTLDEFYKFAKGEIELPDKSFLLTFDDGRKDSYYPVDPILKALDYNAVIFVITRYINVKKDNFYLSKQELQNMFDSKRWELEAHTREGHDMVTIGSDGQKGHYYTNKLWDSKRGLESDREYNKRVFDDIVGAKNDLENNFGVKPRAFAFPFGDFGLNAINFPASKDIMLDITHYAYPMSFYQITLGNGFMYNYSGDNDYLFKRVNVRPEWQPEDLLAIINAGHPKNLPFSDDFLGFEGWLTSSGINHLDNGSLTLKSPADSSNGYIYLDGSKMWKDYSFNAVVDWKKGEKLSLFSRYKFNTNYLACEISDQYIQLISQFDDRNELLSEIKTNRILPRNNLDVRITVSGNKAECVVDKDLRVSYSGIKNEQNSGGIGFKVSDDQLGIAELAIKKVSVSDINNSISDADARLNTVKPLGMKNFLFYNEQNKTNFLSDGEKTYVTAFSKE